MEIIIYYLKEFYSEILGEGKIWNFDRVQCSYYVWISLACAISIVLGEDQNLEHWLLSPLQLLLSRDALCVFML